METNQIFQKLKSILKNYEPSLTIVQNKDDNYYLNTPISAKNKKGEIFGAVQIKKSYVAFHLMPIYYFPELLDSISDELKKHMQGKSCFNFKTIDIELFNEIKILTKSSFEKHRVIEKV